MSALQNEPFIISIFLKTPSQRFYFIKKQKRCSNCFSAKHSVKDCTNPRICRQCSKHHTLLHFNQSAQPIESEQSSTCAPAKTDNVNAVASYVLSTVALNIKVLLATVRVRVYSSCKRFVTVRVLLDQESVSTFISTESLAQRLRLVRINRSICITGISGMQSIVRQTTITLAYRDGLAYSTIAFILRSLTKYLPNRVNTVYNWKHIAGLELADNDSMSSNRYYNRRWFMWHARSKRCSTRFRKWAYRAKYDSRLDPLWADRRVASDWVKFRVCASQSCPRNSRSRFSSLLGDRGGSLESSS